MREYIEKIIAAPLFKGIKIEDMETMLNCLSSFEKSYHKGEYLLLSPQLLGMCPFYIPFHPLPFCPSVGGRIYSCP